MSDLCASQNFLNLINGTGFTLVAGIIFIIVLIHVILSQRVEMLIVGLAPLLLIKCSANIIGTVPGSDQCVVPEEKPSAPIDWSWLSNFFISFGFFTMYMILPIIISTMLLILIKRKHKKIYKNLLQNKLTELLSKLVELYYKEGASKNAIWELMQSVRAQQHTLKSNEVLSLIKNYRLIANIN